MFPMSTILFVNACVRKESRTKRLAEDFLTDFKEFLKQQDPSEKTRVTEVILKEEERGLFPLHEIDFHRRESALRRNDFSDPEYHYAAEFASADYIVIAAPYWDLSFPAVLKQYFEHTSVNGVTFRYNEQGQVEGLCRGKQLIYVTTAGGEIVGMNLGYDYVKALTQTLYGVKHAHCIGASGMDLPNADPERALERARKSFQSLFRKMMIELREDEAGV